MAERRVAGDDCEKNLFSNMQLNVDTRRNVGVEGTQLLAGNSVMIGLLEPAEDSVDTVVEYSRRGSIANASVGSGSGGGGVDDILKRLGNVETGVSELKSQVSAISATVSHLATPASVSQILAIIPHLATKAELADLRTAITSMEAKIIQWIIATVLTTATAAFSIARIVH